MYIYRESTDSKIYTVYLNKYLFLKIRKIIIYNYNYFISNHFVGGWVMKYVVYSPHFSQDSTIHQQITDAVEPGVNLQKNNFA